MKGFAMTFALTLMRRRATPLMMTDRPGDFHANQGADFSIDQEAETSWRAS